MSRWRRESRSSALIEWRRPILAAVLRPPPGNDSPCNGCLELDFFGKARKASIGAEKAASLVTVVSSFVTSVWGKVTVVSSFVTSVWGKVTDVSGLVTICLGICIQMVGG